MNLEKVTLTIKEVSEKSGKKGLYWSITDEKGLKYNAKKDLFPSLHAGDKLETQFSTVTYDSNGKSITSRWLQPLIAQNFPEQERAKGGDPDDRNFKIFLSLIAGKAGIIKVADTPQIMEEVNKTYPRGYFDDK